jgi:hypothetical protein
MATAAGRTKERAFSKLSPERGCAAEAWLGAGDVKSHSHGAKASRRDQRQSLCPAHARLDARRLRPARPRCCDPADPRRMAPADARAPRRRGACRLARRPQCGLSARRANNWRAPRGRRRIRCKKNSGQCEADHTGIAPRAGGSFIFSPAAFSSARRALFFLSVRIAA